MTSWTKLLGRGLAEPCQDILAPFRAYTMASANPPPPDDQWSFDLKHAERNADDTPPQGADPVSGLHPYCHPRTLATKPPTLQP